MDDGRMLEQHHRGVAPCTCRFARVHRGSRPRLTETRETARQEIPEPLRRDVRLLGEILGRVIADYGGESLLRDVEQLRSLVIRARDDDRYERDAEKLIASWRLDRAEKVSRAFACYFHLANLAEEHHRARVIRERDRGPEPMAESLAATIGELRAKLSPKRLDGLIETLEIHPVFTAHPTEARRRAVVTAIRRVGDQLERLDDPRISDSEKGDAERRLIEEVDALWRTAQVRALSVTPLDEVRSFMAVFDETLFRIVPELLRAMDGALRAAGSRKGAPLAAPFLRFGSWIGGDRDLKTAQESLAAAGAGRLAFGELQNLLWQVDTFGFHLAELEIRQHSTVHERALTELRAGGRRSELTREVLDTMRVVASLQERFGEDSCRRYVVSFTRGARDVAAVYELARATSMGKIPVLDVIPLFETLDDLAHSTQVMDDVLRLEPVRRRLLANDRQVEVMLGYSDSAKEAGPLSATLALHDAQAALTTWARKNRVRLTLFHGRGGALGRGGGPANRAVRAQAPGSLAGRFKVTEQGEVIFARHGNRAIARRHLEQVTSAVLEASAPRGSARDPARDFRALAAMIDRPARDAYRALVDAPGFEKWFLDVSPIEELGRLRIASRPSRRSGGRRLEDLRAIPWVFGWSQMRLNLPGWYGMGSGLSAGPLDDLRRAYAEWPLFNAMLDNAEMSLAKTDRRIAERYLALGERSDLTAKVLGEYDLTKEWVPAVTGHRRLLEDRRVLSWAIELRNPYVDALSHLQLRALRAMRNSRTSRADLARAERVFQLTVNGIAAGLQNTG